MVYRFPFYVPGIAAGVAIVAAVFAAVLLWKRKELVIAFGLSGVAVVAGVLVAPMLALDRVLLDDEKLGQTTGFWFAPTVKGFRLAEVDAVTIGTARDRKNREYEVWIVKGKDGEIRSINPGDLWEDNGPDIIQRLRAKGIEFTR